MKIDLKEKQATVFSSLPMQVFMIHAIKIPLIKIASLIASKLPEPTKENTWHPNSHNLIEIRDEFFKHCFLEEARLKLIRVIFNFVIIIYDFDPPWRMMIDWVREEANKKEWKPKGYGMNTLPDWRWWHE